MRYSAFFAALFASAALAAPMEKRDPRVLTVYCTQTMTEIVYGNPSTPTPAPPRPTVYTTVTKSKIPRPRKTTTPKAAPPPSYPTSKAPTYQPEPTPTPSSPPVSPPPSQGPSDDFATSALNTHNKVRSYHGVPALSWSQEMANYAKAHTSNCVFEHSHDGQYGENLAAGYESIEAAIMAWYEEGSQYDYAAGDFSGATGHFTQVVWKGAKLVGCGSSTCNGANGTPGIYYSCNYDTGNVIGYFKENVPPPTN